MDIATGLWPTGLSEGLVFVANTTEFDQHIDSGARLGAVARAAVQTRLCIACGAEDTEAWETQAGAQGCALCGAAQPASKSSCKQCGADFTIHSHRGMRAAKLSKEAPAPGAWCSSFFIKAWGLSAICSSTFARATRKTS